MKYLALALLLCALLSLTNSSCFLKPVTPAMRGMTHCKDDVDGTWHAVGSEWRNSKCWDCTCRECCAAYSTPRLFPDDCVSVFDFEACHFVVHKRDNPTELCPIFAAVGK